MKKENLFISLKTFWEKYKRICVKIKRKEEEIKLWKKWLNV